MKLHYHRKQPLITYDDYIGPPVKVWPLLLELAGWYFAAGGVMWVCFTN